MTNLILSAHRLAHELHDGQFRKWQVATPYITHPMRVAHVIANADIDFDHDAEALVAAAFLHDTLEDCRIDAQYIVEELKHERAAHVAHLVTELTNPSKAHPNLKRAERKAMDREHALRMSWGAKMIKLADRTDNLRDLRLSAMAPDNFKRLYLEESELLFPNLQGVDKRLEDDYQEALAVLRNKLV